MNRLEMQDVTRPPSSPEVTFGSQQIWRTNLVSLVFISTGDCNLDIVDLEALSSLFKETLDFYEIIYIVAPNEWALLQDQRDRIGDFPNLRIIVLHNAAEYEDMLRSGLTRAIGDFIVVWYPGEISVFDLRHLLEASAIDQFELARAIRAKSALSPLSRLRVGLLRAVLKTLVGRPVEPLQCRALCLSRAGLAKLLEHPELLRQFRLMEMSDLFRETQVEISPPSSARRRSRESWRRLKLVAQLVSLRTPSVLTTLSILMLLASILCFMFGLYALCIWLFAANVVEGWTSTTLLISFVGMIFFAAQSAICLGIVQMTRTAGQSSDVMPVHELSNTDLFSKSRRLNVEIRREE